MIHPDENSNLSVALEWSDKPPSCQLHKLPFTAHKCTLEENQLTQRHTGRTVYIHFFMVKSLNQHCWCQNYPIFVSSFHLCQCWFIFLESKSLVRTWTLNIRSAQILYKNFGHLLKIILLFVLISFPHFVLGQKNDSYRFAWHK